MYETQREKMDQAIEFLKEEQIDVWLIYTSESSDPCLPLVTGVKTVGPGAFIFTKEDEKGMRLSALLMHKMWKNQVCLTRLLNIRPD